MFNANYEIFKGMIAGKNVAVLGLGISNLPALEFLHKHGAKITGCDRNTFDKMDDKMVETIETYCSALRLGEDYLENLTDFDIVVKSPGINPNSPQIQEAREKGVIITSEMEMFMMLCPCKIIGVTGSDGKTTTTTLIYKILCEDGKNCHIGGNIGRPLLNDLDFINPSDYVVLELSSFQLQIINTSPDISVITNISPNHLDYHTNMEEYTEAKANIFNFQNKNSRLILNAQNNITKGFIGRQKGEVVTFTKEPEGDGAYVKAGRIFYKNDEIMGIDDIKIRGVHNLENYLAAICAVYDLVDKESIVSVARSFGGVEHRMEYVRTLRGVEFYNDSIGSSPTRTIAGLVAHEGKIVLIAGGYDKNLSFEKLGRVIKERVSAVVLCGATADKIDKAISDAYYDGERKINILKTNSFEDAIKGAFAIAKGFVEKKAENEDNEDKYKKVNKREKVSVILSPACASFDMFKNFEIRGNTFKDIVNGLKE